MIFLNSASSAAALVFYLYVVCAHTDTEGKQRKAKVQNILKSTEKNSIFNKHPVPNCYSEPMRRMGNATTFPLVLLPRQTPRTKNEGRKKVEKNI